MCPIFCVGDSHVNVFTASCGVPAAWPYYDRTREGVVACRLGATTAWGLGNPRSASQSLAKLAAVVNTMQRGSPLVLSFGEIDCRIHLAPRCLKTGGELDLQPVLSCVDRYGKIAEELKSSGFQVSFWNVIPSTPELGRDGAVGTNEMRNELTRSFNQILEAKSLEIGVGFLSAFDAFLNADGTSNPEFFLDGVHLGPKAQPHALEALRCL